mmetsp:Transcript_17964/g.42343  ORF Transcript_17964/g.42343 Transcript_17964/m.42343 type:complete len:357 (+) Transcript_17964:293-1363(+)
MVSRPAERDLVMSLSDSFHSRAIMESSSSSCLAAPSCSGVMCAISILVCFKASVIAESCFLCCSLTSVLVTRSARSSSSSVARCSTKEARGWSFHCCSRSDSFIWAAEAPTPATRASSTARTVAEGASLAEVSCACVCACACSACSARCRAAWTCTNSSCEACRASCTAACDCSRIPASSASEAASRPCNRATSFSSCTTCCCEASSCCPTSTACSCSAASWLAACSWSARSWECSAVTPVGLCPASSRSLRVRTSSRRLSISADSAMYVPARSCSLKSSSCCCAAAMSEASAASGAGDAGTGDAATALACRRCWHSVSSALQAASSSFKASTAAAAAASKDIALSRSAWLKATAC